MRGNNVNDWWELRMDGRVLTTVVGKDRAQWFLANIRSVDPEAKWELIQVGEKSWTKPVTPNQVKNRLDVEYCSGSD